MNTADSGIAPASPTANAVGVNAVKRNKVLNAADNKLFFNMLKPPLIFVFT